MSEIRGTLELIRRRLNQFIHGADPRVDQWVILANLVDQNGTPNEAAKDKIVMFLANIQREVTISTYNPNVPTASGTYAVVAPPLYVDLFLLFYANFYDHTYHQGLGAISRTISFFQQNPRFTHANLPGLDPEIEKLYFEMVNLEPVELNYLMGLTGSKYLPSVYYKVRMIPFQAGATQAQVSAVQGVNAPGEPEV
jgi:Pvc16 N-terminal domain